MSLAPLRSKLPGNPSSLTFHNSTMKNPAFARMSLAPTTPGLNRGWQWAICVPVIITDVRGSASMLPLSARSQL